MAVIYALTSNDITLIGEAAQDLGGGTIELGPEEHADMVRIIHGYRPLPSAL